jgi:tetratricopeptide (TPR) repeat protein
MMRPATFLVLLFGLLALAPSLAQNQPDHDELSINAANAYSSGQWQLAAQAYQAITSKDPTNQGAWFRLGRAFIELKQGQQAQQALQHALVTGTVPLQFVQVQLARAAMLQDQPDNAMQWLVQAADNGFAATSSVLNDHLLVDLQGRSDFQQLSQSIDKNARPCAYQNRYREFDFWLGIWSVYGTQQKTGPLYGHNQISSEQQGCLLVEHWQSVNGGPGTSMNYYDGTKQKWVQHWVSADGTVINMEGALVAGSMVMQGKIYYVNTSVNPVRDFRARFSRLDEGVVRQYFEESIDAGQSWYPWFEGFYFPEPAQQ